jgi:ABC-type uncharacterized transport system permease subunit
MNDSTAVQFIVIAIAAGTPLIYAAVGEILAERAGVMNLGIEGMILLGGVAGYWGDQVTGVPVVGVLIGAAAASTLALAHAVLSISLHANQIVSGIALVILGSGLSAYLGSTGSNPLVNRASRGGFAPVFHGGVADLPVVGPVVFGHDPLVYGSWVVVGAASFYLFRTRWGLKVRAVGEAPASADAAGIAVQRVRYVHVVVGGALAGVAGTYLTLVLFRAWQNNLSNGQGWIAVALVIFSSWRPWRALLAAYLFGALTSLGFNLQLLKVPLPSDVLAAMPYLLALLALIAASNVRSARRLGAPAALATPFWRESR